LANEEGKEFSARQKYDNAAYAFFNQMTLREREPQSKVEVAFPDDDDGSPYCYCYCYCYRMEPLRVVCKTNRLQIFWVSENLENPDKRMVTKLSHQGKRLPQA